MKLSIFVYSLLFLNSISLWAQSVEDSTLYEQLWKRNKAGMITLTSWGGANLASGIIFSPQTTGEAHYFHQMNGMWNTVNFGLGVFGIIKSHQMLKRPNYSNFPNSILKAEKSYRINFYIDFGYVATGIGLFSFRDRFENPALAKGYGESIITQGLFLLGFDWVMSKYIRKKLHKKTAPN